MMKPGCIGPVNQGPTSVLVSSASVGSCDWGNNASQVICPTSPVVGRPLSRWKLSTAARVCSPNMSVTSITAKYLACRNRTCSSRTSGDCMPKLSSCGIGSGSLNGRESAGVATTHSRVGGSSAVTGSSGAAVVCGVVGSVAAFCPPVVAGSAASLAAAETWAASEPADEQPAKAITNAVAPASSFGTRLGGVTGHQSRGPGRHSLTSRWQPPAT